LKHSLAIFLTGISYFLFACGDDAQEHFNRAVDYHKQGKLDEASIEYQKAIEISPNLAEGYIRLGTVYEKQGKFDDAIATYNASLQIDPNDEHVRLHLGRAYEKMGNASADQGQLEDAIAAYKGAIQITPKLVSVHVKLGIAYERRFQLIEAIEAFRVAIKINPNPTDADAHVYLALAYRRQGKLDEAIAQLRIAICMNPDLVWAHVRLGHAYQEHGDINTQVVMKRKYDNESKDLSNFCARFVLRMGGRTECIRPPAGFVESFPSGGRKNLTHLA